MNTPYQSSPRGLRPRLPGRTLGRTHLDRGDEVRSVSGARSGCDSRTVEPRLLVERQFKDIGDGDAGKTSYRASITGLRYHAMSIMSP